MTTLIYNLNSNWSALPADATDSSFPSKIPTNTEPSGNGIIDIGTLGAFSAPALLLCPYATAADNSTFSMRIIGWSHFGQLKTTQLWIPCILAEFAFTVCAVTGVANMVIPATQRFVDTIALTDGADDTSYGIVTPGADLVAHLWVEAKGFRKLELTFQITSGPTAMNALYKKISSVVR